MERQRKSNQKESKGMQSKGMEDSPLKELNEMEVTKISDIQFKLILIQMHKELTDN